MQMIQPLIVHATQSSEENALQMIQAPDRVIVGIDMGMTCTGTELA
jgi:hypothetical protein